MNPTETELRYIFGSMRDVYFRTDKDGCFVIVSPSVHDLLGYAAHELAGHPAVELYVEPLVKPQPLENLETKWNTLDEYEVTLRHKNGSVRWVSLKWNFYRNADGEIAGVEGFAKDIGEKREAVERLRQSEQKLRAIFDHLVDVYYRTDQQGNLLMMSPSAESLLGYKPEELLGKPLSELYVEPAVRTRFMAELKARAGTFYGFENRLRRKDGTEIWAIASSQFYYDEAGHLAGVEGIVKDITHRKMAEEKLQRYSRELQETVRDLETICYSVAHDLRSPLRAINGYAHILGEECGSCTEQRAQGPIGLINKSINRMANLIDDVLNFARTGHGRMNISRFDMQLLVNEIVDEFRESSAEFLIHDLPHVVADRGLICSVISNLLQNSVKFSGTKEKPRIEIGVANVNDEEHLFFVRDNGIGFDQKYANKMFRLFEQLHDNVPEYGGTGIGLAMAKRIVQRHGGRVWAEGAEGEGATFYFSLPISACNISRGQHEVA